MPIHLERVIELINLLDVPEKKKKFWPQHSILVLDTDRHVIDVVQRFSSDSDVIEQVRAVHKYYPKSTMIVAQPGWYVTVADLEARLFEALEEPTDNTYVVGRGMVGNMLPSQKKEYLAKRSKRWWRRS